MVFCQTPNPPCIVNGETHIGSLGDIFEDSESLWSQIKVIRGLIPGYGAAL